MDLTDLRRLKRPQLIELAGHFKIKRRHRLRKRDLIKRLAQFLPQIPEKLSLVFQQPRTAESSSQFAPPAPADEQAPYMDRGAPIPLHYGRDRITALVRDPNCLYVYWELEGPRRDDVIREHDAKIFDEASWILRLHSDEGEPPQDIPVVVEACNWYLPVPEDADYVVEIGIIPKGAGFISLATSNRVHTPRMGVCPDTTSEWMLVEEDFRRVVRLREKEAPRVNGAFADTLAERFRTPDMSSRFLGASERMPGSRSPRKRSDKSKE